MQIQNFAKAKCSTEQGHYLGCDHVNFMVQSAVAAVAGQILSFHGKPIQPFYHSACSGGTASSAEFLNRQSSDLTY